MGDWCSEELTPKLNETTAMVRMLLADKNNDEKISFSRHRGGLFHLTGSLQMGDPIGSIELQ